MAWACCSIARWISAGKVSDEIVYLDAAEEAQYTIAQASEPVDEKSGKFVNDHVLCRSREGEDRHSAQPPS